MSITQTAIQTLKDEEKMMNEMSSPEEILEYIKDDSNFKSLADLMLETTQLSGKVSKDATKGDCINTLTSLLIKQAEDCGINAKKETVQKKVTRWFNGYEKSQSIKKRESAIEICFALGLDISKSNVFLNKCGFSIFNVRLAEDSIYMFCILNGKSLKDANDLMAKYSEYEITEESDDYSEYASSDSKTFIMEQNLLSNSSWESEDEFLNTYLLPNKSKFIGYSTTTLKKYYELKNTLALLRYRECINYGKRDENDNIILDMSDTNIVKICNAVKKIDNSISFSSAEELIGVMNNIIIKIFSGSLDIDEQIHISEVLSEVMSLGYLLRTILYSMDNNNIDNYELRNHKDYSLENTALKNFPTDNSFSDLEKDPMNITSNNMKARKMIILMYYIIFAYESSINSEENNLYDSPVISQYGFMEFWESMDKILAQCRLQQLYPANQFDFLILRSIEEFSFSDYDIETDDPIGLFNDILQLSYEEKQTES